MVNDIEKVKKCELIIVFVRVLMSEAWNIFEFSKFIRNSLGKSFRIQCKIT